jgi:hypothetical protein
MLLYHWRGEARNFGDELNLLLWPRLLPGMMDDDPAELFLGIGSVLDARHARDALKLVRLSWLPAPAMAAMLHCQCWMGAG